MKYRIKMHEFKSYEVAQAKTNKPIIVIDAYDSECDDEQIRNGIRAFMGTLGWVEA